jgi:hypothetical protein
MSQLILHNKQKEITGYCQVSEEDYEHLNKYKWHLSTGGYAQSSINKKVVLLHRYIYTDILKQDIKYFIVDHIDNNRLNNTRTNLRVCTHSENTRNRKKKENSTSKYIGVSFNITKKKWQVSIKINTLTLNSVYENEIDAAYQYDIWCKEYKLKTNINNIKKPKDFVLYVKRDKKGNNIPKGIRIRDNKFNVNIKGENYGRFVKLEDAIKRMESVRKELKDKKIQNTNNIPIKRNEKGECIIELFNKKKEKIAETIVDDENYYDLVKYPWHMSHDYVSGFINKKKYLLHRYILNYTEKHCVDHINGNKLDNRKCNLRIATYTQNSMNRIPTKNTSSKYIGVGLYKKTEQWRSSITFNKKTIHLGYFKNEIDAAKARDIATKQYFGEFGKLNFT